MNFAPWNIIHKSKDTLQAEIEALEKRVALLEKKVFR